MTKLRDFVLTVPDGRHLGVTEWGSADGVPVINLHGTPGSRLNRHPEEAMYERLGMHVVTYDRPGYGVSDRLAGRRVVDAVPDVVAIADSLGFERFFVGGGSGGAPHALACAALLGDRVLRTYAAVPVAPYDALGQERWMADQAPSNVEEFAAFFAGDEALMTYLLGELERMRDDALLVVDAERDLGAVDQEVFANEAVQRVMREGIAESVRNGPGGWFDDDLAFMRYPWGFDLSAIRVPVLLAYGADDSLAPKAHGEYLAGVIPGAEVRIMPAGHLSAIGHAEENWARTLALGSTSRS